jgi:glycosyltransferase involved in cell wall biosynthesis
MKQPRHVLSVVPGLGFGGDQSRLASIVRSMDPSKFRFSVVVMPHDLDIDDLCGAMRPVIEAAGIRVHQLSNPPRPAWLPPAGRSVVRLIRTVTAVARLIQEWQVDLVDARLDGGMITGVMASFITRRPSVSTLYDASPWRKYRLWRLFRAVTLNLTRAVITDSAVRQKELNRWIWNRSASAWNIPNGIPVPTPTRSAAEVRDELGLPRDAEMRIIAQIASLVPHKGQMILLDAAQRVIESEPRAFFLVVGYSDGEKQYEQLLLERAHQLGIADRVRICTYPGPIGDVWQLVDIHAHASIFDSLPNAILEGMALAKPAVVTSVGGIAEAVENDMTGLVVPSNDPAALAQALLRLMQKPDEARSLGAAAKARYESRYRPEAMARALEECFESVLKAGNGREGIA